MARKQSVIMRNSQTTDKDDTVMELKEAKQELAAAKKVTAVAKKDVTAAQKGFVESPSDADLGKAYRTAVAEHIKAAKAQLKAQSKVDKLAA